MKFIKALVLFFLLGYVVGCSESETDDVQPNLFSRPVVTGYEARDLQGSGLGVYGDPNIKLGNESNNQSSEYFFTIFPNPVESHCAFYIKAPEDNLKKRCRIVKAAYQGESLPAHSNMGMIIMEVGGTAVLEKEFTSDRLVLDLSDLNEGFYKVYLEMGGHLLHDNLVKIDNN